MDSLYKGYPVGYVIAWRNPDVRTKDGKTASGKKILIDGQQRVAEHVGESRCVTVSTFDDVILLGDPLPFA